MLQGVDLAKAVLLAKTRYALLSLGSNDGGIFEDKDGYLNKEDEEVRRCYMRIATRIHPDKLVGYADATKAFQALVRAYELCCKPDLRGDESDDSRGSDSDDEDGGDKDVEEEDDDENDDDENDESDSDDDVPLALVKRRKAAAATSKGAPAKKGATKPPKPKAKRGSSSKKVGPAAEWRTGVRCPRCRAEWGAHLKSEGREALYTSFMRGREQVHCLSCLLEFGVNTCTHHCPHCTRTFEYRPSQHHQVLTCPNDKQSGVRKQCGQCFRVARFAMSKAKQAEVEARRKLDDAERRRREQTKEARASRGGLAARYGVEEDPGEEAFEMELGGFIVSEDCPRCGKMFTADHKAHLRQCKGKKGQGAGAVAKRKRGNAENWVVGSYDDDDTAYREPKKPKQPPSKAKKASSSKAKATKAKKPVASTKKAPSKMMPRKKKPRKKKRDDSDDSDSDWSDSD